MLTIRVNNIIMTPNKSMNDNQGLNSVYAIRSVNIVNS